MMRTPLPLSTRALGFLAVAIVASIPFWSGCGTDEGTAPNAPEQSSERVELSIGSPRIQAVMAVQDRHTPELMEDPEIVGTATGLTDDGRPAILVFAASERLGKTVPAAIEGVPVVVQVTGRLKAFKGGGGGVSHTAKQTPPIQLGTSGGWRYDLANGYCCGGTLGSLVQKGGTQYILSNWHVLYSDIVNGGNGRTAQPGDPVIQPGLIDVGCNAANAQNVATLVANGGSLPGANVDAGIAQVTSGMVRTDGAILEVGTISSSTIAAFVGQAVKKSGRTTGLSRATVTGLNGTVTIGYENECAGGSAFNKTFTGQIITSNSRCRFLAGGDSGSLMVQDVTTNPRAVGLLFAGSVACSQSAIAIANPIGAVLSHFGATMVGN
jgi:hypothetical protein